MFHISRLMHQNTGSTILRLTLLAFITGVLILSLSQLDMLPVRLLWLGLWIVLAVLGFTIYRLIFKRVFVRDQVSLLSDAPDSAVTLTGASQSGVKNPMDAPRPVIRKATVEMKTTSEAAYNDVVHHIENNQDFSALAHDLKTPLNAIIGFAGLMESEIKGPLPEGYKDYPPLIREGGETLLSMVEQLLEAARSGRAEWIADCALIDLRHSLSLAQARFTDAACQAGIELILLGDDAAVTAFADRQMVARILDNVISNALKYSPRDSKVFLLAQSQPDGAYLGVRDLGIGMSEADLERIGVRFVQGDNADGRKGTGLGLSIVKRLTQLQSGSLRVRSAPQQGTEIEIILPNAPI